LLEAIRRHPGCNINRVAGELPMSRIAVMKHLAVLEAASLVVSKRAGRERLLWFNPVPLQQVHEHWTDRYQRYFAGSLLELKRRVETRTNKERIE
jgi:predicted ArsR family transcriptional regulator